MLSTRGPQFPFSLWVVIFNYIGLNVHDLVFLMRAGTKESNAILLTFLSTIDRILQEDAVTRWNILQTVFNEKFYGTPNTSNWDNYRKLYETCQPKIELHLTRFVSPDLKHDNPDFKKLAGAGIKLLPLFCDEQPDLAKTMAHQLLDYQNLSSITKLDYFFNNGLPIDWLLFKKVLEGVAIEDDVIGGGYLDLLKILLKQVYVQALAEAHQEELVAILLNYIQLTHNTPFEEILLHCRQLFDDKYLKMYLDTLFDSKNYSDESKGQENVDTFVAFLCAYGASDKMIMYMFEKIIEINHPPCIPHILQALPDNDKNQPDFWLKHLALAFKFDSIHIINALLNEAPEPKTQIKKFVIENAIKKLAELRKESASSSDGSMILYLYYQQLISTLLSQDLSLQSTLAWCIQQDLNDGLILLIAEGAVLDPNEFKNKTKKNCNETIKKYQNAQNKLNNTVFDAKMASCEEKDEVKRVIFFLDEKNIPGAKKKLFAKIPQNTSEEIELITAIKQKPDDLKNIIKNEIIKQFYAKDFKLELLCKLFYIQRVILKPQLKQGLVLR